MKYEYCDNCGSEFEANNETLCETCIREENGTSTLDDLRLNGEITD